MQKRELTDHFDTRFDREDGRDKFDQLAQEEAMEDRLTEDQAHDLYINRLMAKVNACKYVEFNGHSVIGPDSVRMAFKAELHAQTLSCEYDGLGSVEGRSEDGSYYYFKKG